jgi:hypothetical protein
VKVISGAGEFEIVVERVEVRESSVVLVGKMGIWESETIVDHEELPHLLRVALRPRVLGWVLARPFAALRRRKGRTSEPS